MQLFRKATRAAQGVTDFFQKGGGGHMIFRKIKNTLKEQAPAIKHVGDALVDASALVGGYNPGAGAALFQTGKQLPGFAKRIQDRAESYQNTYKKPRLNTIEKPRPVDAEKMFV